MGGVGLSPIDRFALTPSLDCCENTAFKIVSVRETNPLVVSLMKNDHRDDFVWNVMVGEKNEGHPIMEEATFSGGTLIRDMKRKQS